MQYGRKKKILYLIFCIFGIIGVVFGAIVANKYNCGSFINGMAFLKKVGLDLDVIITDQSFESRNFFSHYIIFVFVIWLFGFTALAVYINSLIVFFRGFIYGYMISAFFIEYNFAGIIVFIIMYVVQALIFLPILFRISYTSIRYSINKYNYFTIFKETKRYNDINVYVAELMISVLGLFMVFIIQLYMINPIIQKIGL